MVALSPGTGPLAQGAAGEWYRDRADRGQNLVKHFVADRSVFGRPTALIQGGRRHVRSASCRTTWPWLAESGCGKIHREPGCAGG